MEILGDDEVGLPTPPRRWPIGADGSTALAPAVDVTPPLDRPGPGPSDRGLPDDASVADPFRPDDVAGSAAGGRLRLALDAVAGPEALGLSGVAVAVTGVTMTIFSPLALALRPDLLNGPDNSGLSERMASWLGGFAVVALALGLVGLFRLRPATPAWGRGLTGAATLLGALLLVVAAWAIWRAGSLPTTPSDALR